MISKKTILHFVTESLEDFRGMAKHAAQLGATHVIVSDMPRSLWMWDLDRFDPYPNWSMGQCQLFKLVCPPELEEYLPKDHINECMALVKSRSAILKEYGLKPAIFSNEPFWLPEKVYRDHPSWRGARCDHPRRSRKPYFSPSIDNEEVLSMYTNAVSKLVKETGVDFIHFKTNDCGGGIDWSTGLYTGPNGAQISKDRNMADRICGFLNAIQDGSNGDLTVSLESDIGLKEPEVAIGGSWHQLRENQILNKKDRTGKRVMVTGLNFDLSKQPVKKISDPVQLMKNMMRILYSDANVKMIEIPRSDLNEAVLLYEYALKNKLETMTDCYNGLSYAANTLVGEAYAQHLINAWSYIHESGQHIRHTGIDLVIMGCMHQRWINRPFVLFPGELKDEEKAYYRNYQFQALSEKEAEDLMNLQGIEFVRGFTSAFLVRQTVELARASLNNAVESLGKLPSSTDVDTTILRLEALDCFYENIINAVDFQELVDRTDFDCLPIRELRWPTRNDSRCEAFQAITRAEIDNMYRLISLLKERLTEIILCDQPEREDIFVFSTDFLQQLQKKAEIMLDHFNDGSRVYETNNI